VPGEDAAHRAGPDPMPEAEQLAPNASMPPARVLPRQVAPYSRPTVFLSYAHESPGHKVEVRRLYDLLREIEI
jgi:hypothetical protein